MSILLSKAAAADFLPGPKGFVANTSQRLENLFTGDSTHARQNRLLTLLLGGGAALGAGALGAAYGRRAGVRNLSSSDAARIAYIRQQQEAERDERQLAKYAAGGDNGQETDLIGKARAALSASEERKAQKKTQKQEEREYLIGKARTALSDYQQKKRKSPDTEKRAGFEPDWRMLTLPALLGVGGYAGYQAGKSPKKDNEGKDKKRGIISGGLRGGLSGAGAGALTGAGLGAITGALSTPAINAILAQRGSGIKLNPLQTALIAAGGSGVAGGLWGGLAGTAGGAIGSTKSAASWSDVRREIAKGDVYRPGSIGPSSHLMDVYTKEAGWARLLTGAGRAATNIGRRSAVATNRLGQTAARGINRMGGNLNPAQVGRGLVTAGRASAAPLAYGAAGFIPGAYTGQRTARNRIADEFANQDLVQRFLTGLGHTFNPNLIADRIR